MEIETDSTIFLCCPAGLDVFCSPVTVEFTSCFEASSSTLLNILSTNSMSFSLKVNLTLGLGLEIVSMIKCILFKMSSSSNNIIDVENGLNEYRLLLPELSFFSPFISL